MTTVFTQFKPGGNYPPGPLGDVQQYVFDIESPSDDAVRQQLLSQYPEMELLHWHSVGGDCTCGLHE